MAADPGGADLCLHADAVFCQFFGWSRSGTTLVGALLNAHPEILIGQEADVSMLVAEGATREEVLTAIAHSDSEFAALGRQWNGYDYAVGTSAGGVGGEPGAPAPARPLRVVGDKKAAGTVEVEAVSPGTLALVQQTMGMPLRLICVARDPFDTVATLSRHLQTDTPGWFRPGDDAVAAAVDWYLLLASLSQRIIDSGVAPVLMTDLESLIAGPEEQMGRMLDFLGLRSVPSDYLAACAARLLPRPRRTSDGLALPQHLVRRLRAGVESLPMLDRYRERVGASC
jgi:hypothetical protein